MKTLDQIKALRLRYRISYRELSEASGVPITTIHGAMTRGDTKASILADLSEGIDKVLHNRSVAQEATA